MISYLQNEDKFIYAFIEWEIVNDKGQFQELGEYVYIQQLWIHEDYRNKKVINQLIPLIKKHYFCCNAKRVYWLSLKHDERKSKSYKIERLIKLGV